MTLFPLPHPLGPEKQYIFLAFSDFRRRGDQKMIFFKQNYETNNCWNWKLTSLTLSYSWLLVCLIYFCIELRCSHETTYSPCVGVPQSHVFSFHFIDYIYCFVLHFSWRNKHNSSEVILLKLVFIKQQYLTKIIPPIRNSKNL